MPDELRPVIARLVGAVMPLLLLWVSHLLKIELPAGTTQGVVETSTVLLIYLLTHRAVSAKTNPGDAATRRLAHVEKQENRQLKAEEKEAQ